MTKSGYIYVLAHPSDPDLYKIGVTIRDPKIRLAQHNSDYSKYAGRIVKETGQEWELKVFHSVTDVYWAENVFWGSTPYSVIPGLGGIEVLPMKWGEVQKGIDAAKKAGIRPISKPLTDSIEAYTSYLVKRLEGRGITLLGVAKSKYSKSKFRCSNGHEWQIKSIFVGQGSGCPECGVGERDLHEIKKMVKEGFVCLLTHPEKPGLVNIGIGYGTIDGACKEYLWGDWEIHRYRHVAEVALAETTIWKLLGAPLPHTREPIQKDLIEAEDAMRMISHDVIKD